MIDETIRGKKGIYSLNPDNAMQLLLDTKNVFVVLCHIIMRKNYKSLKFLDKNIKEDEVLINIDSMTRHCKLTKNQISRSLDNLNRLGFIEFVEFKNNTHIKGVKKIRVIVDIFDPCVSENVNEFQKNHGAICFRLF